MLIAHLSDVHVLELTGVRPWQFFNKRVTGGLNLLRSRKKSHDARLLTEALECIDDLACDHVVVTGDLTNLALDQEFERAREILEAHVEPDKLSVIAGNHDRYTLGSVLTQRFEKWFGAYTGTDLPELDTVRGWPYVQLLDDNIALIGVNSAVAQPWLVSGGRVGMRQRKALLKALQHPAVASRYSVVMLHHHLFKPPHKTREFPRGLFDRRKVVQVLADGGANLVLHGHNHYYGHYTVPHTHDDRKMLICEAGSTTVRQYKEDVFAGKFNVYRIEDGELLGYDSWIYRPDDGFQHWRHYDIEGDVPMRVKD